MEKIVKVRESLTFSEFGCDAEHFNKHVKGKLLNVVEEYREIALVADETGEQFTVHKTDIINGSEVGHA